VGDQENPSLEGLHQKLAAKILNGYRIEGNSLFTGGTEVSFEPSEFGYDIRFGSRELGNTSDNYFLVYLTELFEGKDQALERLRMLEQDKRTIQATELQGAISADGRGFVVGSRKVGHSARYFQCSCPDWKFRRRLGGCKHIAALRLLDI
jgi:hypothetical protein